VGGAPLGRSQLQMGLGQCKERLQTWCNRTLLHRHGGNLEQRSRDASSKEQRVATNVQVAATGLWNNTTDYITMPTQYSHFVCVILTPPPIYVFSVLL